MSLAWAERFSNPSSLWYRGLPISSGPGSQMAEFDTEAIQKLYTRYWNLYQVLGGWVKRSTIFFCFREFRDKKTYYYPTYFSLYSFQIMIASLESIIMKPTLLSKFGNEKYLLGASHGEYCQCVGGTAFSSVSNAVVFSLNRLGTGARSSHTIWNWLLLHSKVDYIVGSLKSGALTLLTYRAVAPRKTHALVSTNMKRCKGSFWLNNDKLCFKFGRRMRSLSIVIKLDTQLSDTQMIIQNRVSQHNIDF